MPTYEYRCEACGFKVDIFESIKSTGRSRVCPHCRAVAGLKRQIGAGGGIIFKGSGFYCTDYRKGSNEESKAHTPTRGPRQDDGATVRRDVPTEGR